MSRKTLIGPILWLLVVAACGNDTSTADVPTPDSPVSTAAGEPVSPAGVAGDEPVQTAETTGTVVPAETTPGTAAPVGDGPATTRSPADTSGPTTSEGPAADDEPTTTVPADTAPSTTTTVYTGPVSPVTGLPVEDVNLLDRKLVAVKMDNHWSAQPQSGIEQADAVYELVVEAGLTRFITLFHHSDSGWVGPMRSARPTDWTLIRPLNGVLLISGGQRWITSRITGNDVPLIGDIGPPLTARWRDRKAPHNLYVDTYEARRIAADRGLGRRAPPSLFTRGPLGAPEHATATRIFFDWSDTIDVTWEWDGVRYLRSLESGPHLWRTRDGVRTGQISADVLVVLMAERYTACPQGEGSCVPAWDTVGEGRALVFGEGRYAEGRWSRDRAVDWFRLTGPGGETMTVPPGRLWIMIYPETAYLSW